MSIRLSYSVVPSAVIVYACLYRSRQFHPRKLDTRLDTRCHVTLAPTDWSDVPLELKQPIARKPVFAKIGPGLSLGYRRKCSAWAAPVVAVADGKGGRWTKAIGAADDFEDANGGSILSVWQAQDRARDLARGSQGEQGELVSVTQAVDRDEADLKARGGDTDNTVRVRLHLPDALGRKTVALLTAHDLRQWRDFLLAKGLAPASVNRTLTILRAALNLAADQDERLNRGLGRKGSSRSPMPRNRTTSSSQSRRFATSSPALIRRAKPSACSSRWQPLPARDLPSLAGSKFRISKIIAPIRD